MNRQGGTGIGRCHVFTGSVELVGGSGDCCSEHENIDQKNESSEEGSAIELICAIGCVQAVFALNMMKMTII